MIPDSVGNGGELGQPWQQRDIVTLTLDLDQHTLTGCHQRSGKTEVLNIGQWTVLLVHFTSPQEMTS